MSALTTPSVRPLLNSLARPQRSGVSRGATGGTADGPSGSGRSAPMDRFQRGGSPLSGASGLYAPPLRTGGGGESLIDRLRTALTDMGVGGKEVEDLLVVAQMLERFAPEAAERLVDGFEEASSGPRLSIRSVSLSISITELSASAEVSGDGQVTAAQVSGRQIEVRLQSVQIDLQRDELQYADPLVLDVDGDGLAMRSTADGVRFDLLGDGQEVTTAFVSGDDALLFLDENRNGALDHGGELVGNRIAGLNGFQELQQLDSNGDERLNAADDAWQSLRLAQDLNGDGRFGPGEVALLEELGISELATRWTADERSDGEGLNRIGAGSFGRSEGGAGLMLDYEFGFRPA